MFDCFQHNGSLYVDNGYYYTSSINDSIEEVGKSELVIPFSIFVYDLYSDA